MSYQASHYAVTFNNDSSNLDEVTRIEVYAKDDSDARTKVLMIYPDATNIVVSSGR
jgi:hypothetical protein